METAVYNQQNKKIGTIKLPDLIFQAAWNPDLVHQALVAHTANKRTVVAYTKGRSDVSGGGKKPWRQKGTGRARTGSIRSPLWRGGGITFGPAKEKDYQKKINKKIKRAALFSILSKKLADNEIKIVDTLNLSEHKTKEVKNTLKNLLGEEKGSVLFIPITNNKNLFLASRNVANVSTINPLSLNVYDCLTHKFLFIDKNAVSQISEHYKGLGQDYEENLAQ